MWSARILRNTGVLSGRDVFSGKELYDYERLRAESVIPAVDRIETYAALNDA